VLLIFNIAIRNNRTNGKVQHCELYVQLAPPKTDR